MKPSLQNSARISSSLASALAVLLAGQSAHATLYNWTGATNGTWNTGSNWSGSLVPLITDDLTVLGPLNVAGALTIDFDADNSARSLIFTNTAATSITNTTSGANKTLTLGSGGITSGAGAVQIGSNVANQAINITLDTAQTWNVGAGGMTVTNFIGGAGTGITKTGAGNLLINTGAANTFTGGVTVNAGTLTASYANFNGNQLLSSSNTLAIGGSGTFSLIGHNLAAAANVQTFASTALNAGRNNIVVAKGALAASATLNLGVLTVNPGSATAFIPTTAWTTTASTTERVFITAGGSVPALPGSGSLYINGLFHRTAAGAGLVRWAAVNPSGQLLAGTAVTNLVAGTGSTPTVPVQFQGGTSLALTNTAVSTYGLVLNTTSNGLTLTLAANGTYTLNSIIQQQSANAVTIAPGTGTSNLIIGSERNLVINMDNAAGVTINALIANNGGGASSVTIASTSPTGTTPGPVTFGGANTYTGATYITNGVLSLNNANPLGTTPGTNGTSGISIAAGATLSSATPGANPTTTIAAPITLSGTGNTNLRIGQGAASNTHAFIINGAIGGATGNLVFTTATNSYNNGTTLFVLGAAGTYTGNTLITTGNGANNPVTVRAGVVNALPTTTVLSFGQLAGGGTGRSLTYDLNGNNQTLAGLHNALAVPDDRNYRVSSTGAATLTINNTADFTFGGATFEVGGTTTNAQITGAIALTKSGTGTFTLGGILTGGASAPGNAFTGDTKILGGILVLGESVSIRNSAFDTTNSIEGTSTGGLRAIPTTLTLGGLKGSNSFATRFTTTTGGYTGLTALTLNPGTGVINTYSADIGDGATGMTLSKTGAGHQVLAASQTYTGGSNVTVGGLVFGTLAAKPATGTHAFGAGTTLGLGVGGGNFTSTDVDNAFSGTMTGNLSNVTVDATTNVGIDTTAGNFIYGTSVAGSPTRGLAKFGLNDLNLTGANTFTGQTTVFAGTLTLSNALALQNSAVVISGGSILLGGGVTTPTMGGLSGSGSLGSVAGLTNLTLNVAAGALLTYSGNIDEGAPGMTVTKTGLGIQALSGTNTYTGATLINDGILVFRNKAAKAGGTATTAAAGTIGLGVKSADAAFYAAADVGDLFNTNTLAGFSLDSASGVAIDTTAASFDQTVALTAARSLTKLGANTLTLSQVNSYNGATNITTGTLSLTGSLTGGGAISTSGTSVLTQSAAGVISGASTLTQGSTGISTLAGANSYTGVTNVNLGQLIISNADSLGTTAGNTIVASGGRLAISTASLSVAETLTISGTGTTATNGAIAFGGAVTGMALTGPITLGGAALIQSDGSTGSTISGGISLGANALTINTDGGATQTINTTAITGTGGSLIKSGGGTLILGAANTYSGNTTVSAGTLTLADNAQLKFVLGATSGTNNSLTGAGTTTLNGDFVIDTTAADALATGTWTLENVTTSNYDTTFSVVGFVDAGSNTWTKDVSPNKRYTFDEATGVLTLAPAGNYTSWANDPLKGNIPGELPADDFDKDGISNIVEYALGQNPRVSTQPAGVLSGNIITYTKGADAIANGDVSWVIETSQTLAPGSWTAQVTQPAADPALTIAYTFTPGSPVKNFARLKVTQLP